MWLFVCVLHFLFSFFVEKFKFFIYLYSTHVQQICIFDDLFIMHNPLMIDMCGGVVCVRTCIGQMWTWIFCVLFYWRAHLHHKCDIHDQEKNFQFFFSFSPITYTSSSLLLGFFSFFFFFDFNPSINQSSINHHWLINCQQKNFKFSSEKKVRIVSVCVFKMKRNLLTIGHFGLIFFWSIWKTNKQTTFIAQRYF